MLHKNLSHCNMLRDGWTDHAIHIKAKGYVVPTSNEIPPRLYIQLIISSTWAKSIGRVILLFPWEGNFECNKRKIL